MERLKSLIFPYTHLFGFIRFEVCDFIIRDFVTNFLNCREKWEEKISLFVLYFSYTSHNSWKTFFPPPLFFHVLPALWFPPSSILSLAFLSRLLSLMLRLWCGGNSSWEKGKITWSVCANSKAFTLVLNAIGNSSGLLPMVKIPILKRDASVEIVLIYPWKGCRLDFHFLISSKAWQRPCLFSDGGWIPFNGVQGQLGHK